jgi:hypothetical protein
MTNITESAAAYPAAITQLDTATQVLGGPGGPSNVPLQQLANRTAYLKVQVEAKSPLGHGHAIQDVTGLQAALEGKAALAHGHAVQDVAGLQPALDGKTPYGHAHAIQDVTGLQGALDGKAPSSHTHGIANVTGLQGALDGKTSYGHTHGTGDVGGLDTALAGKAPLGHSHTTGQVAGLDAALAGKAPSVHGHAIQDVTGLQAALDARGSDIPFFTTWRAASDTGIFFMVPVARACSIDLGNSVLCRKGAPGAAVTLGIFRNALGGGRVQIAEVVMPAASGALSVKVGWTLLDGQSAALAPGDVVELQILVGMWAGQGEAYAGAIKLSA